MPHGQRGWMLQRRPPGARHPGSDSPSPTYSQTPRLMSSHHRPRPLPRRVRRGRQLWRLGAPSVVEYPRDLVTKWPRKPSMCTHRAIWRSPECSERRRAAEAIRRVGAALTMTGRGRTSDRAGPASKADRCNESEPVIEPPQATTPSPETGGCGLGHAERGAPEISRATRPRDGTNSMPFGVRDEWLRDRHGRPAGEELGTTPADRAMVNVGTVRLPTSPVFAGWTVRRSVRWGRRAGRSFRSSPSRGKPGTWRREAAGLQRPSGRRGGRR